MTFEKNEPKGFSEHKQPLTSALALPLYRGLNKAWRLESGFFTASRKDMERWERKRAQKS
jgi:hypothetical protein